MKDSTSQTRYPLDQNGGLTTSTPKLGSLTSIALPWMPIFPAHTVRRLRYSSNCSISVASGVPAGYVLRANDLFDPDFTGTGHQPMGFDQMMLSYNHFVVIKATLRAVFRNTNANDPFQVALRQDADNVIVTNPDQFQEFGGCVLEHIEPKGVYGANKVLTLSVDIAKLQGLNRQSITADSTLRGSASASPTEITYFHLMVYDPAGKTGVVTVDYILEQEAVFMEPRDLVES